MEVKPAEVVLCEFYFSDLKQNKLRPVVVFKNNLPFEDFVGMPVSSRVDRLNDDEIVVDESDFSEGFLPRRRTRGQSVNTMPTTAPPSKPIAWLRVSR